MRVFVDASALVAIMKGEEDAKTLADTLEQHDVRLISGLAIWEAALAVATASNSDMQRALELCDRYVLEFGLTVVDIAAPEAREAAIAHDRYGRGTGHPAPLNMGDCFSYGCARTNDARLLYKGKDFSHTDLAL